MNQGYIRLSEVLDLMDQVDGNGNPTSFSMKFVTCNRSLGTGGEIITVESGRKCLTKKKNGDVVFGKSAPVDRTTKNPNHWVNSTRNILFPNGQIRKIHIRLIIEFNGKKVCF